MVDNKYTAFIIEKDYEGFIIGSEEKKLGINARPLPKYGEVSIESFT